LLYHHVLQGVWQTPISSVNIDPTLEEYISANNLYFKFVRMWVFKYLLCYMLNVNAAFHIYWAADMESRCSAVLGGERNVCDRISGNILLPISILFSPYNFCPHTTLWHLPIQFLQIFPPYNTHRPHVNFLTIFTFHPYNVFGWKMLILLPNNNNIDFPPYTIINADCYSLFVFSSILPHYICFLLILPHTFLPLSPHTIIWIALISQNVPIIWSEFCFVLSHKAYIYFYLIQYFTINCHL